MGHGHEPHPLFMAVFIAIAAELRYCNKTIIPQKPNILTLSLTEKVF